MGLFDIFKKKKEIDPAVLEQEMNQNIIDILQDYLPDGWLEVIFFAGYYNDDSGYTKYWVKLENGKYIDCFNLIPVPKQGEKDILQEQLLRLHNTIKPVRIKLDKKNKWVCMELSVTNEGNLSKNYDYADGIKPENYVEYVKDCKDKLNNKFS